MRVLCEVSVLSNSVRNSGIAGNAKRRILIVCNIEPILFALKDYFDLLGYDVDCAHNFQESKNSLSRFTYSVVIADLSVNDIDQTEGLEIVNTVQRLSPSTGTILLAEYPYSDTANGVLPAGLHTILLKPQSLPALAQVVLKLTGNYKS